MGGGNGVLAYATLPKKQKGGLKRRPGDYPTEEDYQKLLKHLEKTPEYHFLARLQANLGVRVTEAISLSKDAIDLTSMRGVKHNITFKRKGGDMDTQPLPDHIYEELRKWKGFTVSRQGFDWAIRSSGIKTRAGKSIHAHALRKLWGHRLYEAGVPLFVIQAGYNHASEDMTRHYLDIHKEDALMRLMEYYARQK